MKIKGILRSFVLIALLSISTVADSQSLVQGSNQRWNLNKYVWSHSHSGSKKEGKPILDFDAIDKWLSIGTETAISADGNYFAYTIYKGEGWANRKLDSIVVQSTLNSWRHAYKGMDIGFFSADNRYYIYKDKESLCFLRLGSGLYNKIEGITSYKLPSNNRQEWIGYRLANNELVLQSLLTGKKKHFSNISDFDFEKSSQWLIYHSIGQPSQLSLFNLSTLQDYHFEAVKDYSFAKNANSMIFRKNSNNVASISLNHIDFADSSITNLWWTSDTALTLNEYSLDESGNRVVFSVKERQDQSIWFWKRGMNAAVMLANNQTPEIQNKLMIVAASFVANGRYIQFSLRNPPTPDHSTIASKEPFSETVKMTIWSWNDSFIQSTQARLSNAAATEEVTDAVFDPQTCQFVFIGSESEKVVAVKDDIIFLSKSGRGEESDRFWKKGYASDSLWLYSIKTRPRGKYFLMCKNYGTGIENWWLSPGGRYFIYCDRTYQFKYFSIDLNSRNICDISRGVPGWQFGKNNNMSTKWQPPKSCVGIAGWLQHDKGLLVYDDYDIWLLDPSGQKDPINLTKGKSNEIVFAIVDQPRNSNRMSEILIEREILLWSFNLKNKYNGYYRMRLDTIAAPELLNVGPWFLQNLKDITLQYAEESGMKPLKALHAKTWIINRQSDKECSNYFVTNDFKAYKQLTFLNPQKGYNWFTRELHRFRHLDGKIGEGILYKPENFDPQKKYPVALIFYSKPANNLYLSKTPQYISSAVAPAASPDWLTSHGYLVFAPDIYLNELKYGPTAFSVIEGAVRYLRRLPYVDGGHIAGGAFSHSAKVGSYVFTHSRSFAAFAMTEGHFFSDPISFALSEPEALRDVEQGFQYGNFWANKHSWLDQTTVLNADKANSPLLLFCGKGSAQDRLDQTMELYMALWRLEKKAWWLQYEIGGGHTLKDLDELKDCTIRYTQFLDHYLKDAPAPKWMSQGLPNNLRGIESRLELDPSGNCGKVCHSCNAWNEQYKRNPAMFDEGISEWKLDVDIQKELDKKETEQYKKNMIGEAERIKDNNAKLRGR